MAKTKIPASVFIILLIAATCAMVYFGNKVMARQLLKAEVFVAESLVVITNINDTPWGDGVAYLDSNKRNGMNAHFIDVQPGAQISIPISDFNEYKNARKVSDLPISEVTIEAAGFQTRSFKIKEIRASVE